MTPRPGSEAWSDLEAAAAFLAHAAARWAARAGPDAWLDYVPRELRVVLHEIQGYGRALGWDELARAAEDLAGWLGRVANHVDVRELVDRLDRLGRLIARRAPAGDRVPPVGDRVPVTVGAHVVTVDHAADPELARALAAREVGLVAVPPEKAHILRMARLVRPHLLLLRPGLVAPFLGELCETLRDDPRLAYSEIWLWGDPGGGATVAAVRAGAMGILPRAASVAEQAALLAAMVDRVGQWRAGAVVDPLTELHSMAYFRARLREELARQGRRGGRLAVLAVRSRLRAAPDDDRPWPARLRDHTRALRALVRREDVAAMDPAGMAFLLLADIDPHTLRRRIEHIRLALLRFWSPPGSVGSALFPDDGETAEDLLDLAEERLLAGLARGFGA
ncbi:MAG: hypothetical protein K6V97_05555 [Actinomycetia bacterium]|nr:hypothetical protein [Actinomycetes bacterium]